MLAMMLGLFSTGCTVEEIATPEEKIDLDRPMARRVGDKVVSLLDEAEIIQLFRLGEDNGKTYLSAGLENIIPGDFYGFNTEGIDADGYGFIGFIQLVRDGEYYYWR